MSGFAEEMAGHDDSFKEAEAATGPALFSDGQHQAAITVARVEQGQFGWQLVLGFRGNDSNTGKPASIRKWHNLPPDEGREGFLAGDLVMLGYAYTERGLSQLEQACVDEEFIGLLCDIGVKTKTGGERDYTNVYINRVHGKVDISEYAAEEGTGNEFVPAGTGGLAPDDDIPFAWIDVHGVVPGHVERHERWER